MNPFLPKPTHSPDTFAEFNAGVQRARDGVPTGRLSVMCRRPECGKRTESKSGYHRRCEPKETP
ncbi:hypothetical protein [Nocardioides alcanivorans]|uniref:hypothetical protein n=1 Tax=Nocardioides alcanivorans TaxID=2897352 RepID=UPI001F172E91|nr:hypothetical protein [Nocardioides alcanivorans]